MLQQMHTEGIGVRGDKTGPSQENFQKHVNKNYKTQTYNTHPSSKNPTYYAHTLEKFQHKTYWTLPLYLQPVCIYELPSQYE